MKKAQTKIGIFSAHDLSRAYSCLFYFGNALETYGQNDVSVTIWGATKKADISRNWRKKYYSLRPGWLGKIRLIGGVISRLIVFVQGFMSNVIVINDLEFFKTAYIIKKLKKNTIVIHYNTEMYGKEEGMPCRDSMMEFYKKHASFPDVIIECLPERALYRKKKYDIKKEIYIINNTIPRVEKDKKPNIDCSKFLKFKENLPILIYAGGCNLSRGLSAMINIIDRFTGRVNFLLFCYGKAQDLESVKNACEGKSNCLVFDAIEREVLFNVMDSCRIGIQYYNPGLSINNKYAAPSKFFEYMAMGLNILSTNNVGINCIINDNKIGECFSNDDEMPIALERILDRGLDNKKQIQNLFDKKYCYEVDSQQTIREIISIINRK